MNYSALTNKQPMTVCIKVKTFAPTKIRLRVFDYDNPKTHFTNRFKVINGIETFYVLMPITSEKINIEIYNEQNGNQKQGLDKSFEVLEFSKKPLPTRYDLINMSNPKVKNFVEFAEQISYNCSYLNPGSYQSKNGKYFIDIYDTITHSNGTELNTPARIAKNNGVIEISKKAFDTYTVPMRMAILLHEFSHYYVNENMDDESEADLNGLLIYLSLGYPRIEAHEAWLDVFMDSASEANAERYKIIEKFIKDFENNRI